MDDGNSATPAYTVRVSSRARRPRLTVTPADGLVVVIPAGYPRSSVPGIVARHRRWIERTLARTEDHRRHVASAAAADVPERIELPGIGVVWGVALTWRDGTEVRARVHGTTLMLSGAVHDREACLDAVRRATARVARERLPLMVGGIEAETGWNARAVAVRRQRTRWGSCSSRGTVSLNESLVFLPQALVRHVIVHELAHTRRMDHSDAFWSLVCTYDAAWREHRKQLGDAWRHVPAWYLS